MSDSAGVEKHSVTIPTEVSQGVRARVGGGRGFSAYVSAAVARQLERDALDEAVGALESEHGPVDEVEVAKLMERLAQ